MGESCFIKVLLNVKPNKIIHLQKLVHSNLSLETKIDLVKELLKILFENVDGKFLVHFSGGKDSLVMLHLVKEVCDEYGFDKDRVIVFHVDTGNHFPGTVNYVLKIINEFKFSNYIIFKPIVSIWWIFRRFGFPPFTSIYYEENRQGRFSYPCCFILKKLPTYITIELVKEVKCDMLGIRAFGEALRRTLTVKERGIVFRYSREHNLKLSREIVRVYPIAYFSNRDIHEYIKKFNLELNPVYKYCSRHGCIVCTAGYYDMSEFEKEISKINQKLVQFVKSKINEWKFMHERKKEIQEFKKKLREYVRKNIRKWKTIDEAIHNIRNYIYTQYK